MNIYETNTLSMGKYFHGSNSIFQTLSTEAKKKNYAKKYKWKVESRKKNEEEKLVHKKR